MTILIWSRPAPVYSWSMGVADRTQAWDTNYQEIKPALCSICVLQVSNARPIFDH